jgi:hypothetical protein
MIPAHFATDIQSVSHGAEPPFGTVLSDHYVFSRNGASYLTRRRVCLQVTLQLTVSQSVSQSVMISSPSRTHDQILFVVKTAAVLFVMGRHPCREDRSVM